MYQIMLKGEKDNIIDEYRLDRLTSSNQPSIFWFCAIFFVPLFFNLIAFQLPFDVVLFNYFVVGIFVLTSIARPRQTDHNVVRMFVWICLMYIILGFVNMTREGYGLLSFMARHFSIPVSLGIVAYFVRTDSISRRDIGLKFSFVMSVLFLFQLVFSIYESLLSADYLVNSYDWNTANKSLEFFSALELKERLQIDYFFDQLNVPFQMTFSGMLGQHNHWGTQLPFYFLLFGYTYFATERKYKYFIIMMGLVAISSLLNTSRFGMISILINACFFFYVLSKCSKYIKIFVSLVVTISLLYYFEALLENIAVYIALTDTFSSRVDTWEVLGSIVFDRNIISIIFGSPFTELQIISQKLDWEDYENLGFTLIFERGIPYSIFFVGFLGVILKNAGKLQQPERLMIWLLVVNMILVSLWSNVLFRFTSFGLVAVMLCMAFLSTHERESELMLS